MTPEQSRSARAWLDWSQEELAAKALVSLSTVRDFEKGRREPIANNLKAMRAALETAGISFVDSDGASGISFAKRKRR
jgi:ribosome-binding protein aMBF1 (putative translation factor)